MDSEHGRSGTRRSGDDYQDIVALETMVDFLEHEERYLWIRVEADDMFFLDDVIAKRADGSFELKQVKYSMHPDRQRDFWTWEKLTEKENGKKSLIEKWAFSVENIKKQGASFKACVESNRRSEEIEKVLGPDHHVMLDKIKNKAIRDKIIEQIGSEDSARDFFNIFSFYLNQPNLTEREAGVKKRFFQMGVTEKGWLSLKDNLQMWIRTRNEPKPDGMITIERIKIAALWHELITLHQKFPIPEDFVVPSEKFHLNLLKELECIKTGCVVIAAGPGMGKSTYLSSLYEHLSLNGVPVIRHHYYLSGQDRTIGRLDPVAIAESLMSELKSKYSEYLGALQKDNANFKNLSEWLGMCGKEFRKKGKALIIVIDGLDYAWREKQSTNELEELFEHIFPTPEGVIVIIGTQPVGDEKIPSRLFQIAPRDKWKTLPPFDLKAIRKWITNYENKINLPKDNERRNNILDLLAEALLKKSGGLPLYLHYAAKTIQEQELEFSLNAIESLPECPHHDVMEYYRILLQRLREEGKQILYLLATCPFPLSQKGIVECLEPKIPDTSQIIKSLHETKHLMKEDSCGLSLFHNSIEVFLNAQSECFTYSKMLKPLILDWLDKKAPEYIKWLYLWLMKAETGDEEPLIMGPNRTWVIDAISKAFPRKSVSQILSRSALEALKKHNIVRVVEIGFLLEYYNSACDMFEIVDNLFFAQLIINDDASFNAYLSSSISSNTHKQLFHLSERNWENQAIVEKCYNELQERQRSKRPRETYSDYERDSLISSLLQTAALYEKIDLPAFVVRLIQAKSAGIFDALETFCQALKRYRKSREFRDLLSTKIPQEDFFVVLKYAILLSFEEDFDLSSEVLANCNSPFSAIYASIRGLSKYSIGSIVFPSTRLFELTETSQCFKTSEITRTYYDIFFVFVANCLWQRSEINDSWIEQIQGYWWPKEFIVILNNAAKELAQLIKTRSSLPFDWLHKKVNYLTRPDWSDSQNKVYSDCAETAINKIAFDLFPIAMALGRKPEITKSELEHVFSTQYCDPWMLSDMLVSLRRVWLGQEALDWVKFELEARINSSISPFSERALNYSKLGAFFARHCDKESSKAFVLKASDNLLAYGYHKDITLFLVLDTLRLCYEADIAETRKWLIQTIPAILWVKEFTDGDETRHLLKEMGEIISKYEPNMLPSHYDWLLEQQDYYNLEELIHSFLKNTDLSDPVNQAVARTAIDEESLLLLHERAKTDNNAEKALLSIIQLLGKSAISKAENKKKEEFSRSTSLHFRKENLPNPAVFPPENFKDYIATAKSKGYFSDSVEKWIEYWKNTSQKMVAYECIKKAVDKRTELDEYDSLFELALSVVGKNEAYPWLVKACVERFGWSPNYTSRDVVVRRWEMIRKYYPDRWFEFMKDTLKPMFGEQWKYVSAHMFVRLVEYCFFMEKPDLAKNLSRQAVTSALELVSPLLLPRPKWVAEHERIE